MLKKFQNKYRIESNRCQFWDYSAPGSYFITICIIDREEILGSIKNNKIQLSEYGKIVKSEIIKIPEYNNRIISDEWVIMPNHIHFIITLCDHYNNTGNISIANGIPNYQQTEYEIKYYRKQRRKMLIPKILGKFKMQTSKQMNILRNTPGKKNWQPDYHDHVIRNNDEYKRIIHYIKNNPQNWINNNI